MGSLFGSKTPTVAPAPPAPTNNDAEVQAASEAERQRRAGMGRASTVLTSPLGAGNEPVIASKKLLGA